MECNLPIWEVLEKVHVLDLVHYCDQMHESSQQLPNISKMYVHSDLKRAVNKFDNSLTLLFEK